MRRLWLLLLLAVAALCLSCEGVEYAPPPGEVRFCFFDVGQADCTLIRTQDAVILVDAGDRDPARADALLRTLRRMRIDTVDLLVLTHPHSDHIGGAPRLLQELTVRECLTVNAVSEEAVFGALLASLEAEGCAVYEGYCGQSYRYGELSLAVLSPDPLSVEELNDKSLVLRVTFGDTALLLPGDISADKEAELLALYGEDGLRADILKAAHHGSYLSSSGAFLDAVCPLYTVLSCGEDNAYGYPTAEVLGRFWERGIRVLRTDLDGTVTFAGDGETLRLLSD